LSSRSCISASVNFGLSGLKYKATKVTTFRLWST
jgi:hypothetical protein